MKPNIKTPSVVIALAAAALLAGCANPGYQQGYQQQGYQQQGYQQQGQPYQGQQSYQPSSQQGYATTYGVVDSIQVVQGNANTGPGLGTVAGVIAGGILGNQVGGGTGKAVATLAGAVGGGLLGNNLENRNRSGGPGEYQIGVRLDNGQYQTVIQDSAADLGIGSRVRIDNGRASRY